MLCFKFHQNRPINEEFKFIEVGGGAPGEKRAPIHKFLSQLLLVNALKCYVSNFIKIRQ